MQIIQNEFNFEITMSAKVWPAAKAANPNGATSVPLQSEKLQWSPCNLNSESPPCAAADSSAPKPQSDFNVAVEVLNPKVQACISKHCTSLLESILPLSLEMRSDGN